MRSIDYETNTWKYCLMRLQMVQCKGYHLVSHGRFHGQMVTKNAMVSLWILKPIEVFIQEISVEMKVAES